jgi:putative transposase
MPRGLKRFQASGQSHFVTFSCYRRLPNLRNPSVCDLLLTVLEETRRRFGLSVYGYVFMPEHVHLLLSEPEHGGTLADAIHFFKFSSAKCLRAQRPELSSLAAFWQKRYYDRNVRDYREFTVKLRYLHRNPVTRGLCDAPDQWPWSSFRHYAFGESRVVEIESERTARARVPAQGAHNPG